MCVRLTESVFVFKLSVSFIVWKLSNYSALIRGHIDNVIQIGVVCLGVKRTGSRIMSWGGSKLWRGWVIYSWRAAQATKVPSSSILWAIMHVQNVFRFPLFYSCKIRDKVIRYRVRFSQHMVYYLIHMAARHNGEQMLCTWTGHTTFISCFITQHLQQICNICPSYVDCREVILTFSWNLFFTPTAQQQHANRTSN